MRRGAVLTERGVCGTPGSQDGFSAVFGERRAGGGSERLIADEHLHRVADDGEEWFAHEGGPRHRVQGPAASKTYPTGGGYVAYWFLGQRHRADGPALVEVWADGQLFETWYRDGVKHRSGGPAEIAYADGKVRLEVFYTDGVADRIAETAADGSRIERPLPARCPR